MGVGLLPKVWFLVDRVSYWVRGYNKQKMRGIRDTSME